MADVVSVEWTCDRCGSKVTTPHGKQPDEWCRVKHSNPPRSADVESDGDVCDECWDSFVAWWRAGNNDRSDA